MAEAERGGRTAIVTGAGRGIGRAIALALSAGGNDTAVADIDENAARATTETIIAAGGRSSCFPVDVSDVSQVSRMVDEVAETYGSVDILVNNAGVLSTTPIDSLTETEWDRTINVNLKGAVFTTQQALKRMIPGGWGRIVNISSMAGRMGGISTGIAYTASKAALIGATMNLARQVAAHGITVNAIAPGTANTEMALGFTPEDRKKLEQSIPVGRLVEPKAIAETVVFLVSEAADFITGAVIDINGGMFMG